MPDPDASWQTWNKYAKRDVEVIMQACLQWWEFLYVNDLGGVAPTLASQAMRAYRHRFMAHDILIDDNDGALELARQSYNGGRVECFKIGRVNEPTFLYDVNSMYPFVMQRDFYPTILQSYRKHCSTDDIRRWLTDRCVVAKVHLSTERNRYAIRHEGKLLFPTGSFDAVLTSPDLVDALNHGEITRVYSAAIYERQPIFKAFIDHFYGCRLEARHAERKTDDWFYKKMMNSLYGKFGQKGLVFEDAGHTDDLSALSWVEINAETGQITKWRQLAGLQQCQVDEIEGRESHPAIAAHVTAYARAYLYDLMEIAGREHVYYCDTDSLLVNTTGRNRLSHLVHPDRLGAIKSEGTYTECEIWGPKDYHFGDKERHKGVRKKAVWLDDTTVKQDRWSSLKGLMLHGDMSAPTTSQVVKHLSRSYDKGLVGADGVVSPLVLPLG